MPRFLSAHGYDPGPTQRPVLAGTLTGILATIPATATLAAMGSLVAETEILDLSIGATAMAGCGAMALAGGIYGSLFQRTANDRRGGWLFGMAYGFLLWAAGGVLVLPLLSGGLAPAGPAAIGLFLSFLIWGTALGAAFPHLHRHLHIRMDKADAVTRARLGSAAAAAHDGHISDR